MASDNLVKQESYFTKREWVMRYASPFKALLFMAGPMIVIMIVNAMYGIIDKQLTLNFAVGEVRQFLGIDSDLDGIFVSPNIIFSEFNELKGIADYDTLFEKMNNGQLTIDDFAKQIINVSTQYSNTIIMILNSLALFTSIGTSIRFGQSMGARDKNKMNDSVITGFFQSLILAVTGTIIMYFLFPLIISSQAGVKWSEKENSIQYMLAYEYSKMFVLGFSLLAMANFFSTLIRTEGKVYVVIITNVSGAVLNILFGILFMDVLDLGMAGAVYGSMVAWGSIIVVSIIVIAVSKDTLLKPNFKTYKWTWSDAGKIWLVGLSPFIANLVLAIASYTATILINNMHNNEFTGKNYDLDHYIYIFHLSKDQLSEGKPISEIYTNIPFEKVSSTIRINSSTFPWMSLLYAPVIGSSQGANVNYAYSYGAKKRERMMKILKMHLMIAVGWFILAEIIVISCAGPMMSAFAGPVDKKWWFVAYLCMMPCAGVTYCVISLFQGVGIAKYSLTITILRALVFQILFIVTGFLIAKYAMPSDGSEDWVFFLMQGLLEVPAALTAGLFLMSYIKKLKSSNNLIDEPDTFKKIEYKTAIENEYVIKSEKYSELMNSKINNYKVKLEKNKINDEKLLKLETKVNSSIEKYNLTMKQKQEKEINLYLKKQEIKNQKIKK